MYAVSALVFVSVFVAAFATVEMARVSLVGWRWGGEDEGDGDGIEGSAYVVVFVFVFVHEQACASEHANSRMVALVWAAA